MDSIQPISPDSSLQSNIPQVNVSSPLSPVKRSNPLVRILIGFVLLCIGGGIGWFLANNKDKISLSSRQTTVSYEDCVKAKGSLIQESYPAICVTPDGVRFTQPLTDEEKQNLLPPDSTADWKTYTNNDMGIMLLYPESGEITEEKGRPNYIIVKYYPSNEETKLITVRIGIVGNIIADSFDKFVLNYYKESEASTQKCGLQAKTTQLSKITFSNKMSFKFQQLDCFITDTDINLVLNGENIYYIAAGATGLNKKSNITIARQILSTFRFLNNESTNPTTTADWKTYENIGYGFSFMYPKDWKMYVDGESSITFFNPSGNMTDTEGIQITRGPLSIEDAHVLSTSITMDGVKVEKIVYQRPSKKIVQLKPLTNKNQYQASDGNLHTMYWITYNIDDGLKYLNTVDQILSTFKFLDN